MSVRTDVICISTHKILIPLSSTHIERAETTYVGGYCIVAIVMRGNTITRVTFGGTNTSNKAKLHCTDVRAHSLIATIPTSMGLNLDGVFYDIR